jgi:hypothetical protein
VSYCLHTKVLGQLCHIACVPKYSGSCVILSAYQSTRAVVSYCLRTKVLGQLCHIACVPKYSGSCVILPAYQSTRAVVSYCLRTKVLGKLCHIACVPKYSRSCATPLINKIFNNIQNFNKPIIHYHHKPSDIISSVCQWKYL